MIPIEDFVANFADSPVVITHKKQKINTTARAFYKENNKLLPDLLEHVEQYYSKNKNIDHALLTELDTDYEPSITTAFKSALTNELKNPKVTKPQDVITENVQVTLESTSDIEPLESFPLSVNDTDTSSVPLQSTILNSDDISSTCRFPDLQRSTMIRSVVTWTVFGIFGRTLVSGTAALGAQTTPLGVAILAVPYAPLAAAFVLSGSLVFIPHLLLHRLINSSEWFESKRVLKLGLQFALAITSIICASLLCALILSLMSTPLSGLGVIALAFRGGAVAAITMGITYCIASIIDTCRLNFCPNNLTTINHDESNVEEEMGYLPIPGHNF